MNSLFRLDIPKRNTTCHLCKERPEPGMSYYSLILEDENCKIIRQDYCSACRHKIEKDRFKAHHGYWESKIECKDDVKEVRSKTLKALALLKEMLEKPDRNEAEVFILALFLARARQLVLRKEIKREDADYYLYESAGRDEFITIKKIDLNSDEAGALQKVISAKLN